jgi:hypothetical protein
MDAAKDLSIGFHAVADHPAVAVRANRRERVDCALEAIEGVMLARNDYFKGLVIFIFANFAFSHTQQSFARRGLRGGLRLLSRAKFFLRSWKSSQPSSPARQSRDWPGK